MSKEAMKLALEHAKRDERHASHAETRYWCRMYRDIAEKAVEALAEQPAPPPECQTEAEKTAFAFGWFKALETVREQPPQQEPVAWICEGSSSDEKHAIDYWPGNVDDLPIGTQLYTSPQAQRTWVGLTDDEILYCVELENPKAIAEEVEAKLREKNT